jgi:hypothetical protein
VEPTEGDLEISLPGQQAKSGEWRLVAHNRRVAQDWIVLCEEWNESALRCFSWLKSNAMTPYGTRCFPLKGKKYAGCWEYEVTKGHRVFYKPLKEEMKVVIYYAGRHPKGSAPHPPSGL